MLDHIQFLKTQGNKRILSDDACKDLVRHFGRYRLRNEDFQFSDLLGAAYEFLINMFAESAGKKGGDFYTPRDVIRLMVRILKPAPGMSVYDPTCGSGGMLIISREFIEQSGGDPTNLRLCGQVNDASAWSICRLNMLLHGVPGADIQLQDTLLHPLHREAGELERFDRVIANPPFSQNYTRTNMEFPERFRWGWCATTGKKGDLMFAQHMLSVCKPGGMVATVMPHGVLFRGSAEKQIRKKFLDEDLIEAIISLPQNLFYGASIPACILVMRPNLTGLSQNPNKPEPRRGRVLFINADAEYHAGRAQNYLRPEHIEKIASTFDRFEDVPGYARVVPLAELVGAANDRNCNIRRYVDNTPLPEPNDVRAHLLGGVPIAEVSRKKPLFDALGFEPRRAFAPRPSDSTYYDLATVLADRTRIRGLINDDAGVRARHAAIRDRLMQWWAEYATRLADLPRRRDLNRVRSEILDSFITALLRTEPDKPPVLDRFKLAGVIATWWTDTLADFKTLIENGFPGVVDGWIDAIADAVEDDEATGPTFDPFAHKLVRRTMADYLERTSAAKREIIRLKGEKDTFEESNAPDDLDEEELASWNYTKELERQARELKADNKAAIQELKKLENAATKRRAPADNARRAEAARMALAAVLDQLAAVDDAMAPYADIKVRLAAVRAQYRTLTNEFVREFKARCDAMNDDEKKNVVLELFAEDIKAALDGAVSEKREELVRFVEGIWDKYRLTLAEIHAQRTTVEERLAKAFKGLSYT